METGPNHQNVDKFDRWAKSYGNDRMAPWFTSGQAKIIDALNLREDHSLLDVGCGTGWAVTQAAQFIPHGKACGIDISPGMIERAAERAEGLPNVEFKVADAETIPYPDQCFDRVMCTNSFHHYSEPVQALLEMRRVLKPEGQIVIRDSDRGACLWVRLWDLFNRIFERGHVKYYTLDEVFQLLNMAGVNRRELVEHEHSHFQKGKLGSAIYVVRAIEEKP